MQLLRFYVFCKVYETLSITRTAEMLHITQPGVSKHILGLEDYYHTPFFFRHGRTLKPTEAGEIFYRFTSELISKEAQIERILSNITHGNGGSVSLGASRTIGNYYLPPIFAKFKQSKPNVYIKMKTGDKEHICQAVLNGELDIGVILTNGTEKDLITIPLREEPYVLVASPQHPLAKCEMPVHRSELIKHQFITPYLDTRFRELVGEMLQKSGLDWPMLLAEIELNDIEPIKQTVETGISLAFLFYEAVRREVDLGFLMIIPIEGIHLSCQYAIVYRENFLSTTAAALIDFIIKLESNQ